MDSAVGIVINRGHLDAVIFDLDGVVTDTAKVHAAAWKRLFDEYLAARPPAAGEDHAPFTDADYRRSIDGRPRYDGVASFLESRGVSLPRGDPSDREAAETVCGLGNRKNRYFHERLAAAGVEAFDSTVHLVRRLQDAGFGTAVFSASRNCQAVLEAAGLGDLFPVRVDGVVAAELGLPGKPDPAVLLEAAGRLGADPARCAVVEDAEAGVEAGRRGGFALVIGVDRTGHGEELRARGADAVVRDLAEVGIATSRPLLEVPDAFDSWDGLAERLRIHRPALFLDFDGTLSPIVDDPAAARLADGAREVLARLAAACPVAVISGRDLDDVRARVDIAGVWYAGNHGFELQTPDGERHQHPAVAGVLPALDDAAAELSEGLAGVPGARVERKRFAVAVHDRTVADDLVSEVVDVTTAAGERHPGLRVVRGRRVTELRPDIAWDKGRALGWLLDRIETEGPVLPVYAGDDITDEDALGVVQTVGLGIVVRSGEHGNRPTAAHVAVDDPAGLCRLLGRLADLVGA